MHRSLSGIEPRPFEPLPSGSLCTSENCLILGPTSNNRRFLYLVQFLMLQGVGEALAGHAGVAESFMEGLASIETLSRPVIVMASTTVPPEENPTNAFPGGHTLASLVKPRDLTGDCDARQVRSQEKAAAPHVRFHIWEDPFNQTPRHGSSRPPHALHKLCLC